MSLLKNLLLNALSWTCFIRFSTFQKCLSHTLASLSIGHRKTITYNIRCLNLENQDWSSHYKLYSRDRWDAQMLFSPIIARAGTLSDENYIEAAADFTTIKKTGKNIPNTALTRDPMSPKYRVNLIWGMIFLQTTIIVPWNETNKSPSRSLPVQWHILPRRPKPRRTDSQEKWDEFLQFQKENNRSEFFLKYLQDLRSSLDAAGWKEKNLLISLDGDFCNRKVLQAPRDRIELILRARKTIKLCHKAPEGGRRFYDTYKFTPEEVRQDESREWETAKIFHGGEVREVFFKEVKQVCWQSGAKRQLLRLIIVRPIPYRRTKSGRLLYRQPAYLLTTDHDVSCKKILQAYFNRWEIEVNHKEEKHLLGVGQAQLRNERAIEWQSTLVVASYSNLLLASLEINQELLIDTTSWYQQPKRPSIKSLCNCLTQEIAAAGGIVNILESIFQRERVA